MMGAFAARPRADKDDAGSEGVRHARLRFRVASSERIGQVPLIAKPRADQSIKEGLPASAGGARIAFSL